MSEVTIFYDASCPLCVKEMKKLKLALPTANFINVLNLERMAAYPDINVNESRLTLHILDKEGELRLAVDANAYLWKLTGQKSYWQLSQMPLFRPVADVTYRIFAFSRYAVSKFLTGQSRSEQCEL